MTMSEAKRIHPAGILIRFIQEIRQLIFPIIAIVIFSRNQAFPWYWNIIFFGVALAFILLHGFLSWYRFTYRIDEDEIHIQSGVIVTRKRHIHRNRVHTISLSAGLLQRMFGLVQLRIETAGGGSEPEVRLEAISKEEAKRIRKRLDPEEGHQEASVPPEDQQDTTQPNTRKSNAAKNQVYRLPVSDLIAASFTSASFGVVMAGLAFVITQLAEYLPETFYTSAYQWVMEQSIIFIAGTLFLIAAVAWIISVLITVLQYANFTISLDGERYKIDRGLLEKKEVRFTTQKIQAVRLIESPLRQLLGYTSVVVESAGGSDDPSGAITIIPLIRRKQLIPFMEQFLPQYVPSLTYEQVPRRALRKYVVQTTWLPLLITIAGFYFLPSPWSWYLLPLPVLGILLGWLRWRDAGWNFNDKKLSIKYRLLTRYTVITYKKRIQALQVNQSPLQRRSKLGTLKIYILSAGARAYRVIHMKQSHTVQLRRWYSR